MAAGAAEVSVRRRGCVCQIEKHKDGGERSHRRHVLNKLRSEKNFHLAVADQFLVLL